MKILIVTSLFPLHPQDKNGKFIYDSILALHALGHEIKVLVTQTWKPFKKKIQLDQFPNWLEIKICHFPGLPRYHLFSFSIFSYKLFISPVIRQMVTKWKCDLMHVHSEVQTLAVVNVGKSLNIPVITTIHGAETTKRYWKAASKTISQGLKKVDRVVLVGHPIKKVFDKLVSCDSHFRIIYNGFDAPATIYEQQPLAWSKKVKLVSVCNLTDDGKGIDINLHALAKLRKQGFIDWNYTIVGDGSFRTEFESLVQSLELIEHVQFVGACNHNIVFEHLLAANIFCLPSYCEAFGIAHLEAMASGLLVIGVKGQGPEIFVTHDQTGLLVAPKNIDALVDCLKYAFINPKKMQTLALKGKKLAWENFTWQHHAKQLDSVYQELITLS